MNIRSFVRLTQLAMFATALCVLTPQTASAGKLGQGCLDQTGCCQRCPSCDHVCKLDAKEVEVEKECFETETKVICIPRVVFPWQKKKAMRSCAGCDSCDGGGCTHCVHNGARTRTICVLKTKKYKCPACEYTWSAEKKPCGCIGACDEACDSMMLTVPMPVAGPSQSWEGVSAPVYQEPLLPPTPSVYQNAYSDGLETVEVQ
ncbi:hypothetical protein [Novipirellula artificiosorum]|uniref:4Fe-4S ferredoxin-type domain-containing protein n=1 Tax=Novipirellula artificiosorum TaxID=2528016 RepID=A0A5C6DJ56_9BACT|nr:hypothetical protein [Novipirellula artificiosorum]TWU36134.1 hypothetical protein Poly41_38870 [Novipirellula artificiosorum]